MNYKKIYDILIERALNRNKKDYNSKIYHWHHIVPIHIDANSKDMAMVTIKEHAICHFLLYKINNMKWDLFVYKFLKGLPINHHEICSEAGKIGGKKTKENQSGIFNPDWDRSENHKKLWEDGVFNNVHSFNTFSEMGKIGGKKTKENQSGIFNPDLQYLRSEWAKIGGYSVVNRGGIYSEKWREENKDRVKEICSKAGKIGGKITGAKLWWNNGENNKRSNICPGEGWIRGMLMSEKKKSQVFSSFAGHNRRKI